MIRRYGAHATVFMSAMIAGCAVGPDYQRPKADVPDSFVNARKPASVLTGKSTVDPAHAPWVQWWTKFSDPELDTLIARAVSDNHDLKIAAARVAEARATGRIVHSLRFPDVGFGGGAAKSRGSAAGLGFPYGAPSQDHTLYQFGFDASYEVDLFGAITRSIESADATAEETEDQRRVVQITLTAEVARAYISLRTLQRRLDIARLNLVDQQHTLNVVQRRMNNGLAADFDLVRARAEVEATEANIPPLESGVQQTIYMLSVLTARPPEALVAELSSTAAMPPLPPVVPIGLPSELLRRRPDIMAAERALASATADEGVAISDLFPHVIIAGTAGVQSTRAFDLFSQHSPSSGFYLAGPGAHWTLFDGGRRFANIDRSKAVVESALAAYEESILKALADVDSAVSALNHDQERRDTLMSVALDAEKAVKIARDEYTNGLVDLLDVLEVQRSQYAAQDSLAQADLAVSTDLVSLFKALGGGWETTPAVPAQSTAATTQAVAR